MNNVFAAALLLLVSATAHAQSTPPSPLDYLIQKVCVDAHGKVQSVDPYQCSNPQKYPAYAGYTLRNLKPGEPLPYHRVLTFTYTIWPWWNAQPSMPYGAQYDSYPVIGANGQEFVVHPFDYIFDSASNAQAGQYQPGKGYDLETVRDHWVSDVGTSDPDGFGQSWLGRDCQSNNGWIFFPDSTLTDMSSGESTIPMRGDYWEENSDPWPGWCVPESKDPTFFRRALTGWQFVPHFAFGGNQGQGLNNSGLKTIDALYVLHGFIPDSTTDAAQHEHFETFLKNGHLEAFHFTKLYGFTRWEGWVPTAQLATGNKHDTAQQLQQRVNDAGKACSVTVCSGDQCRPLTMEYQKVNFTLEGCADYSGVDTTKPSLTPPIWPIPEINLLRNFHFNTRDEYQAMGQTLATDAGKDNLPYWNVKGTALHIDLKNSTSIQDSSFARRGGHGVYDGKGIRYLTLRCDGSCTTSDAIYQELPVTNSIRSGLYTYGAIARAELKEGAGNLEFSLSQIDSKGRVLHVNSFTASATPTRTMQAAAPVCDPAHMETGPNGPAAPAQCPSLKNDSVFLSSSFLTTTIPLTIDRHTAWLRIGISPQSPATFDIVSAWLMQDDRSR